MVSAVWAQERSEKVAVQLSGLTVSDDSLGIVPFVTVLVKNRFKSSGGSWNRTDTAHRRPITALPRRVVFVQPDTALGGQQTKEKGGSRGTALSLSLSLKSGGQGRLGLRECS